MPPSHVGPSAEGSTLGTIRERLEHDLNIAIRRPRHLGGAVAGEELPDLNVLFMSLDA